MSMKKRLFTFLLATVLTVLAFSLFPISAEGAVRSGSCGRDITWELDTQTGEMVISGTGEMYYGEMAPGLSAAAPWYMSRDQVKTVRVEEGITLICENAFYNCANLTSVSLPSTVTSIKGYAFSDCSSLTSINIPAGVTEIGLFAFYDCTALKELKLPDSLKSLQADAFSGCKSLITNEGGISYVDHWAVSVSKKISTATLKDGTVGIAQNAFISCERLKIVNIPDSVKTICDGAFRFCEMLQSVQIPEGVTTVEESLFRYCYALETVSLPSSITSIENYAFEHCTSLEKIYFAGTEEQWNTIKKGEGWNDTEKDVTVIFHAHEYGTPTAYTEQQHQQTCACGEIRYRSHEYGDWEVIKEASQSETGEKQRQCLCGHTVSEVIPTVTITTDATENTTASNATQDADTNSSTATGCYATASALSSLLLLLPSAMMCLAKKSKRSTHS